MVDENGVYTRYAAAALTAHIRAAKTLWLASALRAVACRFFAVAWVLRCSSGSIPTLLRGF